MATVVRTALGEVADSGAFVRKASVYRNTIDADGPFQPVAGRYSLYVSLACPWASRCVAVLNMKGLQHAIKLVVVHPTWQRTRPNDEMDLHTGWVLRHEDDPPLSSSAGYGAIACLGCIPDTHGTKTIRDLYEKTGDTNGKYSVPVLWDNETETIVNNESEEIVRLLNGAFNGLADHPEVDLCPVALMPAILETNAWVYPGINNGVYQCGFARSQAAYDAAIETLCAALDKAETLLATQRYLCGAVLTEADIRLFVTLIRFDEVYGVYFKTNVRAIREYPNLLNHSRELLQIPAIRASVDFGHIKHHYFTSHPTLNAYAVVPRGPGLALWDVPHDRDRVYA